MCKPNSTLVKTLKKQLMPKTLSRVEQNHTFMSKFTQKHLKSGWIGSSAEALNQCISLSLPTAALSIQNAVASL